jgi:hypothetical protein
MLRTIAGARVPQSPAPAHRLSTVANFEPRPRALETFAETQRPAFPRASCARRFPESILCPPLSTERRLPAPDGLVRIALKKPFSDGTVAVDLDPLSLLCRLVALVPAPRFHTLRYSGVLAAASKWRPLIVPKPESTSVNQRAAVLRPAAGLRGRLSLSPLGRAAPPDLC